MKPKVQVSATPNYPHLITLGTAWNTRWMIGISNTLVAAENRKAHAFHAPGSITADGRLTRTGKRVILEALSKKAPASKQTMCVVWSPHECTYFMHDGTTIDGNTPPEGQPIYPEEYEIVGAEVLDVRYIALPEEAASPFLCIRRIDAEHVEVSSGDRMILGHFDELPYEGPGSELRRFLDGDGLLVRPDSFRGARTTEVSGDGTLLGQVQPDGQTVRIVAPWPQLVFAACEEVAECSLPPGMLQAAWRAVDPIRTGMMQVGVLEAV